MFWFFHSTCFYGDFIDFAAPHQAFLPIGSEVPLGKKSSFPPGEAKSGSQKLVPSIGRLNFVSFGQMLPSLQNLILNFPIHERSFLWTH